MSSQITNEQREKIYDELADLMIDAMSRGEVDVKQAKEMAQFVLGKLDNLKLEEELYGFIELLCKKWNIYNKVYIELRSKQEEKIAHEKIAEIQGKLASLAN